VNLTIVRKPRRRGRAAAARKLDLPGVRALLEKSHGREYWRSLEDLAQTDAFQDLMHREFPRYASEWEDGDSRRNFIKLMGASLALAGLTACTRQPTEQITPYVRQPEELVPGRPLFFATAMPLGAGSTGLLVESHEGRPTKVEGNPDHPSQGACDVYAQASVLGLYDPDRSQALTLEGEIRSWGAFLGAIQQAITQQKAKRGAGLRILTETVTSPTLANQIKEMLAAFPAAKWHQWEPAGAHSSAAGARLAFGQPVNTVYDLRGADVIVSLDADFLSSGPGSLRYARQFSARRRVRGDQTENEPPVRGRADADSHRHESRSPHAAAGRRCGAVRLEPGGGAGRGYGRTEGRIHRGRQVDRPMARDLQKHQRRQPGDRRRAAEPGGPRVGACHERGAGQRGQDRAVHGAGGSHPVDQVASLYDLVKDLDAGAVDLLLILGGNPAYNAPVELGFRDRLKKAALRVHLSLHEDETSELCHWHLPTTHYLETWSDCRAHDGTVTIMQPLIAPLYAGKSAHEVLTMLTGQPERTSYQIVKAYWATQHTGSDFEAWWRKAVHDGVVRIRRCRPRAWRCARDGPLAAAAGQPAGLEVVFRPDPAVYDGRFANNGWLQEWPRPITQLTWDNAAIFSPKTAQEKGVVTTDLVEIAYRGYKMRAPVFIQPGHADGSVTVHLGYGRTRAGHVGTRIGFNAYGMRTSSALWQDYGLDVRKVGSDYLLVSVQDYHALDTERHTIEKADIAEYRKNPNVIQEDFEQPPPGLTLYPGFKYDKYAWGMAIDLSACTGCGACVVACQAENNIAVVGKEEVHHGRHMHWLRVDSYYHGDIGESGDLQSAGALHAVRERAVRAGVSGAGHQSQQRRPERHGVQPLRGHALLLEQLPVQGAPVQLLPVLGFHHAAAEAAAQPGRERAQPRRDGEVHLLRAAHQPRQDRFREGGSQGARRRDFDGVPGNVSGRSDCFRQYQRPEQPGGADEGGKDELRAAGGFEYQAAHDLSGGVAQPESGDRRMRCGADLAAWTPAAGRVLPPLLAKHG
jgi:MoCo/4Fe-4S cofactor protein with predicted Tat translocation signal